MLKKVRLDLIVAIYMNSTNCGNTMFNIFIYLLYSMFIHTFFFVMVFARFEYSRGIKWRSTFIQNQKQKQR